MSRSLPTIISVCLFFLCTLASPLSALSEGKIPITTSSDEAKDLYVKGRDLNERLRGQESLKYFQDALTKDPDFALAHLGLAGAQSSAKGFFESLRTASSLKDKVSEGERLWILGVEAGSQGLQMRQQDYFKKLVAAYPNDERAHNLLGNNYFALQEYERAILEYEKAIKINPQFSQPYNQMGYAYRFLGRYEKAEDAFRRYIDLIPDDPNPYDSYAELLMRIGKYQESITNYEKALAIDRHFVPSFIGIATNLNFMGKHADARSWLDKLYQIARNDGERRSALFSMTVSYLHEGDLQKALAEQEKMFAIAEEIEDAAAMAGDLNTKGLILLESGKIDEAAAHYQRARQTMESSDLLPEVKENAGRIYLYNSAQVALARGEVEQAKLLQSELQQKAQKAQNRFQIWLAHELAGRIAFAQKNYDQAIAELEKANLQNPYNLYRLALVYEAKGDTRKASDLFKRTVQENTLNNLNYGFVRSKATKKIHDVHANSAS